MNTITANDYSDEVSTLPTGVTFGTGDKSVFEGAQFILSGGAVGQQRNHSQTSYNQLNSIGVKYMSNINIEANPDGSIPQIVIYSASDVVNTNNPYGIYRYALGLNGQAPNMELVTSAYFGSSQTYASMGYTIPPYCLPLNPLVFAVLPMSLSNGAGYECSVNSLADNTDKIVASTSQVETYVTLYESGTTDIKGTQTVGLTSTRIDMNPSETTLAGITNQDVLSFRTVRSIVPTGGVLFGNTEPIALQGDNQIYTGESKVKIVSTSFQGTDSRYTVFNATNGFSYPLTTFFEGDQAPFYGGAVRAACFFDFRVKSNAADRQAYVTLALDWAYLDDNNNINFITQTETSYALFPSNPNVNFNYSLNVGGVFTAPVPDRSGTTSCYPLQLMGARAYGRLYSTADADVEPYSLSMRAQFELFDLNRQDNGSHMVTLLNNIEGPVKHTHTIRFGYVPVVSQLSFVSSSFLPIGFANERPLILNMIRALLSSANGYVGPLHDIQSIISKIQDHGWVAQKLMRSIRGETMSLEDAERALMLYFGYGAKGFRIGKKDMRTIGNLASIAAQVAGPALEMASYGAEPYGSARYAGARYAGSRFIRGTPNAATGFLNMGAFNASPAPEDDYEAEMCRKLKNRVQKCIVPSSNGSLAQSSDARSAILNHPLARSAVQRMAMNQPIDQIPDDEYSAASCIMNNHKCCLGPVYKAAYTESEVDAALDQLSSEFASNFTEDQFETIAGTLIATYTNPNTDTVPGQAYKTLKAELGNYLTSVTTPVEESKVQDIPITAMSLDTEFDIPPAQELAPQPVTALTAAFNLFQLKFKRLLTAPIQDLNFVGVSGNFVPTHLAYMQNGHMGFNIMNTSRGMLVSPDQGTTTPNIMCYVVVTNIPVAEAENYYQMVSVRNIDFHVDNLLKFNQTDSEQLIGIFDMYVTMRSRAYSYPSVYITIHTGQVQPASVDGPSILLPIASALLGLPSFSVMTGSLDKFASVQKVGSVVPKLAAISPSATHTPFFVFPQGNITDLTESDKTVALHNATMLQWGLPEFKSIPSSIIPIPISSLSQLFLLMSMSSRLLSYLPNDSALVYRKNVLNAIIMDGAFKAKIYARDVGETNIDTVDKFETFLKTHHRVPEFLAITNLDEDKVKRRTSAVVQTKSLKPGQAPDIKMARKRLADNALKFASDRSDVNQLFTQLASRHGVLETIDGEYMIFQGMKKEAVSGDRFKGVTTTYEVPNDDPKGPPSMTKTLFRPVVVDISTARQKQTLVGDILPKALGSSSKKSKAKAAYNLDIEDL